MLLSHSRRCIYLIALALAHARPFRPSIARGRSVRFVFCAGTNRATCYFAHNNRMRRSYAIHICIVASSSGAALLFWGLLCVACLCKNKLNRRLWERENVFQATSAIQCSAPSGTVISSGFGCLFYATAGTNLLHDMFG